MIVQLRAFLLSAAVLLLPTTQAAASCVIAGFSGAASICGAASVTGYSTGQMNQTATPLLTQENSTGVSVGASGGGPGIGGFASATGTFGTVKMFTSSFTSRQRRGGAYTAPDLRRDGCRERLGSAIKNKASL